MEMRHVHTAGSSRCYPWCGPLPVRGRAVRASVRRGSCSQPADKTLRVLILSGPGGEDWLAKTSFLRQILTDTGRFDVRVCETPAGLTARTLLDFDVLVDLSGGSAIRHDPEGEIARFVATGKGLVITHSALAGQDSATTPQGCWPARITVGSHPPVRISEVRIVQPDHAVTRGIPIKFKIADALPRGLVIQPGAEVLASARDEINSGQAGSDQPILLASHHGNGRVFCTAMGHDLAAMHEPAFIATLARGTEWAATGKVTLPAGLGLPRPKQTPCGGL